MGELGAQKALASQGFVILAAQADQPALNRLCANECKRGFLRHKQPYLAIFAGSVRQVLAGHHFDNLPVLSEELFRVLDIGRLHFNAASSPSAPVRYLKVECVIRRPHVFMDRLMIAAHSVSPLIASNWDILGSQIGFSCGAISKLRRCALPRSRESKSLLEVSRELQDRYAFAG